MLLARKKIVAWKKRVPVIEVDELPAGSVVVAQQPTHPKGAHTMLTYDHVEIKGPHHKYDSSMAMYCDYMAYQGLWDEAGGDVETVGCYARFGKHITTEDSQGFVAHHRFISVAWAQTMFDALEELSAWAGGEELPAQYNLQPILVGHRDYCMYVYRSALLAEARNRSLAPGPDFDPYDLFTYYEWLLNGRPSVIDV